MHLTKVLFNIDVQVECSEQYCYMLLFPLIFLLPKVYHNIHGLNIVPNTDRENTSQILAMILIVSFTHTFIEVSAATFGL